MDAVLRAWKEDELYEKSAALFYADDGLLESSNSVGLQNDLDIIIKLFEKVGLRTNETKTKFMVFRGPNHQKQ